MFSTVYFHFRNYRNTGAVFVSKNTVPLLFLIKKCESKNGGVFRRPFPTVFIPTESDKLIMCRWWLAKLSPNRALLQSHTKSTHLHCRLQLQVTHTNPVKNSNMPNFPEKRFPWLPTSRSWTEIRTHKFFYPQLFHYRHWPSYSLANLGHGPSCHKDLQAIRGWSLGLAHV